MSLNVKNLIGWQLGLEPLEAHKDFACSECGTAPVVIEGEICEACQDGRAA